MIESPCNGVCQLNPAIGLCMGCGRSADEIGGWASMPATTRRSVIAELPQRMRDAGLDPTDEKNTEDPDAANAR